MLGLSEAEFISVNDTILITNKKVKGYTQCQTIFTLIERSNQTVQKCYRNRLSNNAHIPIKHEFLPKRFIETRAFFCLHRL